MNPLLFFISQEAFYYYSFSFIQIKTTHSVVYIPSIHMRILNASTTPAIMTIGIF